MAGPQPLMLHATSVAVDGRAAIIRGPSGSGKSALALQMIALGAELIADDRTCIHREGNDLIVDAPDTIRGRLEARGVGILNAPAAGPARAVLVVDLPPYGSTPNAPRLPPDETEDLLGVTLPLVRGVDAGHFPAALHLYLKYGRSD